GPRELALIEESTITVVDVDSGAQLRSFTHSFDGDDDIIANLWPGPDGGFWLVHDSLRPAATKSLWLIDREGARLEKLAQDVHFSTVTEVDGRWLWAVEDGGKLSVPNARKLPAQPANCSMSAGARGPFRRRSPADCGCAPGDAGYLAVTNPPFACASHPRLGRGRADEAGQSRARVLHPPPHDSRGR